MDRLQQKTAVMFARLRLENALDRSDWADAAAMSRLIDEIMQRQIWEKTENVDEKEVYR